MRTRRSPFDIIRSGIATAKRLVLALGSFALIASPLVPLPASSLVLCANQLLVCVDTACTIGRLFELSFENLLNLPELAGRLAGFDLTRLAFPMNIRFRLIYGEGPWKQPPI